MATWLLTSTFYGQWLPGHPRGSVTNVRDRRPGDPNEWVRIEHAIPGEEYKTDLPGLRLAAIAQLKGPPVIVDLARPNSCWSSFRKLLAIAAGSCWPSR